MSTITTKQLRYITMVMKQRFNERGRKFMVKNYFNKKSTLDFTQQEAVIVIELLTNHQQLLNDFFSQNYKRRKDLTRRVLR